MKKKKEQKKELEKDKIEEVGSFASDLWSKLIVVLVILCFLGLFYLLTIYITNKNNEKEGNTKDVEEVEVSTEDVMLGRIFSLDDHDDYLVLCYDKSDEDNASDYENMKMEYRGPSDNAKVYVADLNDGFNKKYVNSKSNANPKSPSDLAINGPTLIRFSEGKVTEYIEGKDNIKEYLTVKEENEDEE